MVDDAHSPARDVRAALALLGIERLVLSIHQTAFPAGDAVVELGCGTPYGDAGARFLAWVGALGFTGVALGPAGVTSRDNASPYDSTWFGVNPMFLDVGALPAVVVDNARRFGDALDPAAGAAAAGGGAERVDYERAWDAARLLTGAMRAAGLDVQALLAEQHATMRARAAPLRFIADAQIGISYEEKRAHPELFLPGYAMGAPPSRTNPDGQPWAYPVLHPAQMEAEGPAHAFVVKRLDALLAAHDGLRVDHPHGWVCPWVYRTDDGVDALVSVQHGARLFESPDLADHPALAAFARVAPEQIDRSVPRYDDDWVRALTPAQINRYARGFDLIVERAKRHGVGAADLMVEVLSTCPKPLEAVLVRHGLGRFRVTQKANVSDAGDCYRSDAAAPADWILVSNHDTPPLRLVIARWSADERARRAAWLGALLRTNVDAGDDGALADAMLAELFASPARNALVFWPDLFGLDDLYNRPGVVHADNWKMRVPRDFARAHHDAVAAGRAPSLTRALGLALRARVPGEDAAALAARLLAPSLRSSP